MSEFINGIRSAADGGLDGVSDAIILAMGVVCGLLIVISIFALGVSIFLAISYVRYNKKQNSCGKTGEQIARTILDRNGLGKINVQKAVPALQHRIHKRHGHRSAGVDLSCTSDHCVCSEFVFIVEQTVISR